MRRRSKQAGSDTPRGLGQLTLVEHTLCPLDPSVSLRENFVHECAYSFTDPHKHRREAHVRVDCPAGLSANDEFFLWGLLALTFAQPEPTFDFQATPHYCLRRLGCISGSSRGGKSYAIFRAAIDRLAAVRYRNDRFYDPVRREHRAVCFGFFSYSLPLDPHSSRAWRIVWDPLFFEFCRANGSQLRFDLDTYRDLDLATRRLFLLLQKVFWRRATSPEFDLRHLAVNVLGFAPTLETRKLKAKVKRCVAKLLARRVIELGPGTVGIDEVFEKRRKGEYTIRLRRGPDFRRRASSRVARAVEDSPLFEPLRSIGFEPDAIGRILGRFEPGQVQLWADVTLAALERKGRRFFRRSPQAFFMDNIQRAASGTRTPPDWFHELKREESRRHAEAGRRVRPKEPSRPQAHAANGGGDDLSTPADRAAFEQVVGEMLAQFRAAGQSEHDARRNARRFAEEHLLRRDSAVAEGDLRALANLS